jgi:hypothetical protein
MLSTLTALSKRTASVPISKRTATRISYPLPASWPINYQKISIVHGPHDGYPYVIEHHKPRDDQPGIYRAWTVPLEFENVIVDEGHCIKNPSSLIHASIRALTANFKLIVTGTPLMNGYRDVLGYMRFAWKDDHMVFDIASLLTPSRTVFYNFDPMSIYKKDFDYRSLRSRNGRGLRKQAIPDVSYEPDSLLARWVSRLDEKGYGKMGKWSTFLAHPLTFVCIHETMRAHDPYKDATRPAIQYFFSRFQSRRTMKTKLNDGQSNITSKRLQLERSRQYNVHYLSIQ